MSALEPSEIIWAQQESAWLRRRKEIEIPSAAGTQGTLRAVIGTLEGRRALAVPEAPRGDGGVRRTLTRISDEIKALGKAYFDGCTLIDGPDGRTVIPPKPQRDEITYAERFDVVATNGMVFVAPATFVFVEDIAAPGYGEEFYTLGANMTRAEVEAATWTWGLAATDYTSYAVAAVPAGSSKDLWKWNSDLTSSDIPEPLIRAFGYAIGVNEVSICLTVGTIMPYLGY